jgi:hypothetical protein
MIIRMMTRSRPQRRYDHRLRDLVQRTGDLTIATDLGVPRSTARGWLGAAPTVVVSLERADLTESELRQEILKLRRRVEKRSALLRLALPLLHTSGFRLSGARLPDGPAKLRILRAVERARECIPLRAVLRFMRVSPSRFQAWSPALLAGRTWPREAMGRSSPRFISWIRIGRQGRRANDADALLAADGWSKPSWSAMSRTRAPVSPGQSTDPAAWQPSVPDPSPRRAIPFPRVVQVTIRPSPAPTEKDDSIAPRVISELSHGAWNRAGG